VDKILASDLPITKTKFFCFSEITSKIRIKSWRCIPSNQILSLSCWKS